MTPAAVSVCRSLAFVVAGAAAFTAAHLKLESERASAAAASRGRIAAIRRLHAENVRLAAESRRLEDERAAEVIADASHPPVASRAEAVRLWLELKRRGGFRVVAKPRLLLLDAEGRLSSRFGAFFALSEADFAGLQARVGSIKAEVDRRVMAAATSRVEPTGAVVVEVKGDAACAALRADFYEAMRAALGPDGWDLFESIEEGSESSPLRNDRLRTIGYFGDAPRTFTVIRNPNLPRYVVATRSPEDSLVITGFLRPDLKTFLGPLAELLPKGF
jgi:hypothetical protein